MDEFRGIADEILGNRTRVTRMLEIIAAVSDSL